MNNPRYRPLVIGAAILAVVWGVAWAGYKIAANARVTPEKVRAHLHQLDLSKLTGNDRAAALRKLADMMTALTPEERRTARFDPEWNRWFAAMTDEEKVKFIEATLPSGFKQMLAAFEELPPDKRRRAVADSLKRLKEARENPEFRPPAGPDGAPPPPPMSEELQQKVTAIGLNAFYSQSSAQSKAELAPLIEEIQRSMESGRLFRGR